MHGIAIGGVVLFVVIMAVVARFALAGVGPFEGTVAGAVPDADGLAVSLSVTNQGNSAGHGPLEWADARQGEPRDHRHDHDEQDDAADRDAVHLRRGGVAQAERVAALAQADIDGDRRAAPDARMFDVRCTTGRRGGRRGSR